MQPLENIFKIATEAAKMALIELDKKLIEQYSPKLDYLSIKINPEDYNQLTRQLAELSDLIFDSEQEPLIKLHSLIRPLVCTQDQLLPKIAFTLTDTKDSEVDYVSFSVDSLATLHTHFGKHKKNPSNIETYPDGNKHFFVELNQNKLAFTKTGFAEQQEIVALRTRLQTELDSRLHLMADFQNYKKRTEQMLRESTDMASKNLLNQVMEIIDDSNRAMQDGSHDGLNLLVDKMKNLLREQGLTEIAVKAGDKFNPEIMEAINSIPASEGQQPNTVLHIDQLGYKYIASGKIYRTSRVIVTK